MFDSIGISRQDTEVVEIDDSRIDRCKRRQLIDTFVIAICATICGTDSAFGGGSEHWQPSSRAKRDGSMTWLDTARLASSITYRVDGSTLTMGTNVIYGRADT